MNGGDDMPKTKPTYADSLKKITDADNAVKQALARKRDLMMRSPSFMALRDRLLSMLSLRNMILSAS